MNVEISNVRNCDTCNKSTVCKYKEEVSEEVSKITNEMNKLELPLCVKINCNYFEAIINRPKTF